MRSARSKGIVLGILLGSFIVLWALHMGGSTDRSSHVLHQHDVPTHTQPPVPPPYTDSPTEVAEMGTHPPVHVEASLCTPALQEANDTNWTLEEVEPVPALFEPFYDDQLAFYETKIEEWKPSIFHPMAFGATLGGLGQADTDLGSKVIWTEMDIFVHELELDRIDLYLPYDVFNPPFTGSDQIKLEIYDQILDRLNTSTITPLLADGGEVPQPLPWREFTQWHLTWIQNTTQRYKPHAIIIAMDPWFPWDQNQKSISDYNTVTPTMVAQLANQSANLVKTINPQTKTIIALPKGKPRPDYPYKDPDPYQTLLELTINNPKIDIYGVFSYGLDDLIAAEEFTKTARNAGKEIWVIGIAAGPLDNAYQRPWAAPLRAKFITATIYWAQKENATYYSYMWSLEFISYDQLFILYQDPLNRRTVTYLEYRDTITEVREQSIDEWASPTICLMFLILAGPCLIKGIKAANSAAPQPG